MKRLFVLLMAITMVLALCACGGDTDEAQPGPESEPVKTEEQKLTESSEQESGEKGTRSNPYSFDEPLTIRFFPVEYADNAEALAEVTYTFVKYYSHEELVELEPGVNWDEGTFGVLVSADYSANFDDSHGISVTPVFHVLDDGMKEHIVTSSISGKYEAPRTVYSGAHYDYLRLFVEDYAYTPKYLRVSYYTPTEDSVMGYEEAIVWVSLEDVVAGSEAE